MQTNENNISVIDILKIIKKWVIFFKNKKKIIIIFFFFGLLLGYLISDKSKYTASLTFAMEDDKTSSASGGLSGAIGLASSFGIDLGNTSSGGAFAANNLTVLMKSRKIIEKALLKQVVFEKKKITLADYYIFKKSQQNKFKFTTEKLNIYFPVDLNREQFSFKDDSLMNVLYLELKDESILNVQQKDKKISILTIEVNSFDEFFTKTFCENLAKETSDFYIQTKIKKSKLNVEILKKQVDSIKNQLNSAIVGVAKEADNVYNLNPAFNVNGSNSKKKQVEVQANTAILTNLVVQLELANINLRKETPLIQLIDSPIFPLKKEKHLEFKNSILGSLFSVFIILLLLVGFDFANKYKSILKN